MSSGYYIKNFKSQHIALSQLLFDSYVFSVAFFRQESQTSPWLKGKEEQRSTSDLTKSKTLFFPLCIKM